MFPGEEGFQQLVQLKRSAVPWPCAPVLPDCEFVGGLVVRMPDAVSVGPAQQGRLLRAGRDRSMLDKMERLHEISETANCSSRLDAHKRESAKIWTNQNLSGRTQLRKSSAR